MNQTRDLIIALLIGAGGGTLCILGSILNWDWFYNSRKAQFWVKIMGRKGARIFYACLGAFLYLIAYKIVAK